MNKRNYNILSQVKTIADQDVLSQVEAIAEQYKPDDIYVTDNDWAIASAETKELLIRIRELDKPLLDAYWEAVNQEDWKQALLLYQVSFHSPSLASINRTLFTEEECIKTETEFINEAKEWVGNAEETLRGEGLGRF